MEKRKLRSPFLIVNVKSYVYGKQVVALAQAADEIAQRFDIDILFTTQAIDAVAVIQTCKHLFVTAQTMDGIVPGRGMGHVLPEALKEAGVEAVVLNHAECPKTISALTAAVERAKEVGLLSIVCADTPAQCAMLAQLHPDVMICEPSSLIGTGTTSNADYIFTTNRIIREIDPAIQIIQAAGVKNGDDVYQMITWGADGSGGTSGIVKAKNPNAVMEDMAKALQRAKQKREEMK